jgi:hypothetical protein
METIHELLHSTDKFGSVNYHGRIYKFYWIILFFETFKCGDSVRFWGNVETDAQPLCSELCHFV